MTAGITIANRGSCRRLAIELIGMTTKRDDPTMVGQFGSGTAFAVALALREGLEVRISSVDELGPYTMEPWADDIGRIHWRFRPGSTVARGWWHTMRAAVGRARSVPTSFTAGFGELDWEGAFPVVREFVANARDADPDGYRVWPGTNTDLDGFIYEAGDEGVTVVEIIGEAAYDVIQDWDYSFRFECGLVDHTPQVADVHRQSPLVALMAAPDDGELLLFVKGVRIPHGMDVKSRFSYSLDTGLTEARTLKSQYDFMWRAGILIDAAAISSHVRWSADLIKWVAKNPSSFEASISEHVFTSGGTWTDAWRMAFGDRPIASPSDNKTYNTIVMPHTWAAALKSNGIRTTRKPLGTKTDTAVVGWTSPDGDDDVDASELALEVVEHYEKCLSGEWDQGDPLNLSQDDIDRLRSELDLD